MLKHCMILFCILFQNLYAQNLVQKIELPDFKHSQVAKENLYKSISYKFGETKIKSTKIKQKHVISSKITHHIWRDKTEACTMLLFAGLKDLQEQALKLQSNKIVNIVSYIDANPYSSTKYFQCKVGMFFSFVTLRADVLK